MSFNLRTPTLIDGLNHWSFRKGVTVETIRKFDPDLLGTQECVSSQAEFLREQLREYDFVGAGRDDGKRRGEMCGVFFKRNRFEQIDAGHFWLSDRPNKPGSKSWGTAWTRMVTWVKLRRRDSGQIFCLFNTHFDVWGKRARVESAELLTSKMQSIARDVPYIVTGDFNDVPESETYRALTAGARLTDTFRAANPNITDEESTRHGFGGGERGPRIDWILTSASMQTIAAKIDRNREGLRYPSDHFPIQAVVRLPIGPARVADVR
jgi:endonuclease/exonuclease/phosphatase family metal-dependent hydrolase